MKHTPVSFCVVALILAVFQLSTPSTGRALDNSQSPFAGTVWTIADIGNGISSKLTFGANGSWSEETSLHPLHGNWRTTKDNNIVEVTLANGKIGKNKVIHFVMSADGTKCSRVEEAITWTRQGAQ
jgi:hypothetical protein